MVELGPGVVKEPKHISSLNRNTAAARKKKEALIERLGGKCQKCGTTENLQFDHIHGRDYNPNKLSYKHRLTVYEREAAEGKLQLLCEAHNLKARVRFENGRFARTEHKDQITRTTEIDLDDTDIPF